MSAIIGEASETFGISIDEAKAACKEDINFLGALVLGVLFRCDLSEIHIAFFQILTQNLTEISKGIASQIALGLPRGFCKTTLLKLYCLWVILFTDIRYILVVSKSADLAEFFIKDVCDFLDNSNIISLFGNWRTSLATDRMDVKIFSFNGTPRVLQAIGAETSVRGTNINNERPELIICEDIQDKDCADSAILNEKFITWFVGTLLKVKSSFRNQVVFLGNMYNEQCLLNRLRQSTEWFSFITSAIQAGRKSLWPEFRSYESLMAEFRNDISLGQPHVFLAEVMNDPLASAATNFDLNKIPAWPYYETTLPDGAYITIDPAPGTKEGAASSNNLKGLGANNTFIEVAGKKQLVASEGNATAMTLHWLIDGKDCIRKIKSGQWNEKQTVEEAIIFALEEGASHIGVESVAYQAVLLNIFIRTFNENHIEGLKVIPLHPKGRAKNARIKDLLKRLQDGLNPIHPDARPEVFFQASRFKPLKKNNDDDSLDSAAYGEEMKEEYWHEIRYNARTYDGEGNRARVWDTVDSSAF